MAQAWRLVKTRYASDAFTGEGARIHGGRWNSAGVAVAYASSSLPLAVLELAVHFPTSAILPAYSIVEVEFDDALLLELSIAELPGDWKQFPPPSSTQALGDQWVAKGASAVLSVPSAVLESERNYVFNVNHPDITRMRIRKPRAFQLDSRIVARLLGRV